MKKIHKKLRFTPTLLFTSLIIAIFVGLGHSHVAMAITEPLQSVPETNNIEENDFVEEKSLERVKEIESLQNFLLKKNPELAEFAEQIIQLPRFIEVLAISKKETSYCTKGVGRSKNNCGAIRGKGGFKKFPNSYEGLEALATLLQKPLYKDKSIAQMNGIFCVHEASSTGRGKCPNWTEEINKTKAEIETALN